MTRKWMPFLADDAVAASPGTKKFKVMIKPLKLDGLTQQLELLQTAANDVVAVEATLATTTGRRTLLPLVSWRKRRLVRNLTTEKPLRNGCRPVEWTEDEFRFSFSSRNAAFHSWGVTFSVLHGQSGKKMVNLGGVRLKFAKLEATDLVEELPVTLQFDTFSLDVSLTLSVTIFLDDDLSNSGKLSNEEAEEAGFFSKSFWRRKRTKNAQGVGVSSAESDESAAFDSGTLVDRRRRSSSMPRLDSGSSRFEYLKRKLSSFRNIQPLTSSKPISGLLNEEVNVDRPSSHFSIDSAATSAPTQSTDSTEPPKSSYEECLDSREINWESKELESRDGKAKLAAKVSFASFDQRSEEAAGASACTAIVANIAHWLHANQGIVPTAAEFESIIKEGSLEWQKLCEDPRHLNCFPNRHFDLETVFRAHDKPVTLLDKRSFYGFISPEKFKALEGVMSCDSIWDEIHREMEERETRIYIIGWNDHFFVLMMQKDAYYIIDSLGERLSEGCDQAYILKFDESAEMFNTRTKEEVGDDDERVENEEIICSGKDCCKEYIQRFLAAITLEELEEEEKKSPVSSSPLHQRLQIEFHYTSHSTDVSSNSSVF